MWWACAVPMSLISPSTIDLGALCNGTHSIAMIAGVQACKRSADAVPLPQLCEWKFAHGLLR